MFGECGVAVARSRVRDQCGCMDVGTEGVGVEVKGDVEGACGYRSVFVKLTEKRMLMVRVAKPKSGTSN